MSELDKQKIRTAVQQTRELRDHLEQKNAMYEEYVAVTKNNEKKIRELCKLIEAGDQDKFSLNRSGNDSLFDVICSAISSYKRQISKESEQKKKLFNKAQTRLKEKNTLEEALNKLRSFLLQAGFSESDLNRLIDGKGDADMFERFSRNPAENDNTGVKEQIPVQAPEHPITQAGNYVQQDADDEYFTDDDSDDFQQTNNQEAKQAEASVTVKRSISSQGFANSQEKRTAASKNMGVVLYDELGEKLVEEDWDLLLFIGDTGINVQKDLYARYIKERNGVNENGVRSRSTHLKTNGLLVEEKVSSLSGQVLFSYLSEAGESLYCRRKGVEELPVEPFWKKLMRNHSNLDHGYGVYLTAEKFRKCSVFQVVEEFSPTPVRVGAAGRYEPDILCVKNDGTKFYVEFEHIKHPDMKMREKITKMLDVTDVVCFVVVNKTKALEKMNREVVEFLAKGGDRYMKGKSIRILPYQSIDPKRDLTDYESWYYVYMPPFDSSYSPLIMKGI